MSQALINALISISPILLMGLAIIVHNIVSPGESREDAIERQCSAMEARWAKGALNDGNRKV